MLSAMPHSLHLKHVLCHTCNTQDKGGDDKKRQWDGAAPRPGRHGRQGGAITQPLSQAARRQRAPASATQVPQCTRAPKGASRPSRPVATGAERRSPATSPCLALPGPAPWAWAGPWWGPTQAQTDPYVGTVGAGRDSTGRRAAQGRRPAGVRQGKARPRQPARNSTAWPRLATPGPDSR